MGLIKALFTAASTTLADQWKEYFYCEALSTDVLMTKGVKRTSSKSSNTKGSDNIISNGSGIAVADGQCMIIVEQGRIVEICAEPGLFTWDSSTEPSIFAGKLGQSIIDSFKKLWARTTYGGDTGNDQRIYYINTKEILDNKFGTANPVPFRVVDSKINMDLDVAVRCSGVYTFKIANPVVFYTKISGNVTKDYLRSDIEPQLKAEFLAALQPGFAKLSDLEIRPNQIIAHNNDLQAAMKEELTEKWAEGRGIEVVDVSLVSVTLPDEDAEMIKQAQRAAMAKDPTFAAAQIATAQAEAMKTAAGNSSGAMNGFIGMGMAMNAGGTNVQNLYTMGQQQAQAAPQPAPAQSVQVTGWTCACGNVNTGKFCTECGAKKPEDNAGWTCPSCGAVNKGKFCTECGARKPEAAPLYRCDKCGWEPADPTKPPKFCPECGDPFDEKDIK